MKGNVQIATAASVGDELIEAIQRLIPQLSSSARVPGPGELQEMVGSPVTTLLLARDTTQQGRIVGTLTLAVFRIPTGVQ
jgi:hypothetical protein